MPYDKLPTPKKRGYAQSPEELRRIAEIVYTSPSQKEAAKRAKVSPCTLTRLRRHPAFIDELGRVREEAMRLAQEKLKTGEGSVLEIERECMLLAARDMKRRLLEAEKLEPSEVTNMAATLLKNVQTRQGLPTEFHKHYIDMANDLSGQSTDELKRRYAEMASRLEEAAQAIENPYGRKLNKDIQTQQ